MRMEHWALKARTLWSVKQHGDRSEQKKEPREKLLKNKLNLIVSLENQISKNN